MIPFPDLSPNLFEIEVFGFALALRWYALAYIVGILFGWWIILRAVRRPGLWSGPPPLTRGRARGRVRRWSWSG